MHLRPDVRIAPLTLDHAVNMYHWMCDPEVSVNLGLRDKPSMEKTIAWINGALADDSISPFAALLDGRHVGNVVLDRIDRYANTARMSVYIGESSARASGVGFTSIYLVLAEGFEKLGLDKIWLTVHAENIRAINTYIKLGFQLEGIHRGEFILDGRRLPALYMGLLKSELAQL